MEIKRVVEVKQIAGHDIKLSRSVYSLKSYLSLFYVKTLARSHFANTH